MAAARHRVRAHGLEREPEPRAAADAHRGRHVDGDLPAELLADMRGDRHLVVIVHAGGDRVVREREVTRWSRPLEPVLVGVPNLVGLTWPEALGATSERGLGLRRNGRNGHRRVNAAPASSASTESHGTR